MTQLGIRFALAAALLLHPLAHAHWPDQAPHQIADLGEFEFEGGGRIPNLRMSYVTHGKLNAAKDNAILFMHGFGGNHHLADHLIGPGLPLDTDKYFIICSDELGNTQTGFEHSSGPTNSGLKMSFPGYNLRDRVNAEHRLITKALGIQHLHLVTGISSGGFHSIQFAVSYPDFMDGIVPIVGGAQISTQGFFFGSMMASVLETCAGWDGGNYEKNPQRCAANALSWLIPYFYTRDWWKNNVDTPEAYSRWRNSWGAYYLDVQEARDLYYRLAAFGRGWIGDTPGFGGDLSKVLGSIRARTLYILSPQDQFFPPEYMEAEIRMIPGARAVWIDSDAGHLICCNADPNATRTLGEAIRGFLRELEPAGERRN
jgi:homoserine O-acetyltransferase